jgi:SAM-dependent methyltransferase
MRCPICKKYNSKYEDFNIYEIDCVAETNIEYFLCKCTFLYYRHDSIKKIYNENNKYIISNTGSGASLKYDLLRLENSFNLIREYLQNIETFLDIGCNNGSFLKRIKSFNNAIALFGTDVSLGDETLKHLNSLGIKIKKTENPKEFNLKFNFISILHVLEHIDNIDIFFQYLQDLLDEDGYIYIEVPDADGYLDNYFQPFSYFDLEHINHFSLNSITLLIENFGFNIQKSWHFKFKMSEDIYYPGLGILIKKNINNKKHTNLNISNKQMFEYISKSQ